ncbi:MAG: hypothetical protein ACI4T7_04060 [Alloprevotella sp.]
MEIFKQIMKTLLADRNSYLSRKLFHSVLTIAVAIAENSVKQGRKFGLYRNSFEKKGANHNFAA